MLYRVTTNRPQAARGKVNSISLYYIISVAFGNSVVFYGYCGFRYATAQNKTKRIRRSRGKQSVDWLTTAF